MPRASKPKDLLQLAHQRFGIDNFREGQREIIEGILDGHDVVGILPTGAGKSLCFQLPSTLLPGSTVVVSPLLALVQDQLKHLEDLSFEPVRLDSTLSTKEERQATKEIRRGEHEFIYVTPEQLEKPERLETLKRAQVSLLVVDEAHCVSAWGHDFRPAYLSLKNAIEALGRPRVLALTATATPRVQAELIERLALNQPRVVRSGVMRPNLHLSVLRTVNRERKWAALLELLEGEPGATVIYTATVRAANEVHEYLLAKNIAAVRYHGKLKASERAEAQAAFMEDRALVVVATKAFGLGIDKPNIRTVVHFQFPDSLESFYQEAGRAGRDGLPARAVLFYRLEDRRIQGFFLGGKYPRKEEASHLYSTLLNNDAGVLTLAKLAELTGIPLKRAQVIIAQLLEDGVVKRTARGLKLTQKIPLPELELQFPAYEERAEGDRERLKTMMHFGQSMSCRWRSICEYFEESLEDDCGHCDVCLEGGRSLCA